MLMILEMIRFVRYKPGRRSWRVAVQQESADPFQGQSDTAEMAPIHKGSGGQRGYTAESLQRAAPGQQPDQVTFEPPGFVFLGRINDLIFIFF